ncbi:MAG: hypothetical protein IKO89_07650, partial [Bacteroidales bacterium]|nr:hypothetical protein [Bacteroidales bacterium]
FLVNLLDIDLQFFSYVLSAFSDTIKRNCKTKGSTALRSCRSYPCRDRASGRCRHNPFGHGAGAYKKHTARSSAAYTPSGSIFQSACRGWR